MVSAPRDELIGETIGGRYEVLRLIGKGGVGAIYEVRNLRLGHSFALKTLNRDAAAKADALQRFRREADIVARIKHPNIVEVIDWDELPDGSPCIVMEYLRGEDLATRIRRVGALGWDELATIADQILAALTTTHANGIVHRDLKPHNVFLATDDSGVERVKLLDFGVSKIRDSTSLQTMNNGLVGTPAYMAPEQAEGQSDKVGPHTDIWAMGVILHEMATGVRAFDGPSLPAILYAVCHGEPAPITTHRPDAPAAFVELIGHALERTIDDRLGDAGVMRDRLRVALAHLPDAPPVQPRTVALADTIGNSALVPDAAVRRSGTAWRWGVGGVVVLGGAGAAIVFAMSRAETSAPPPAAPIVEAVVVADAALEVDATMVNDASASIADAGETPGADVKDTGPKRKLSYVEQIGTAIGRKQAALQRCVGSTKGDVKFTATIDIAPDGHARSVVLAPPDLGATPLGTCLRDGLLAISYPTSTTGGTVAFPLSLRAR